MTLAQYNQTEPLRHYMKSIPKTASNVSNKPMMRDGVCVGVIVSYVLPGGVPVVKELPNKTYGQH